MRFTLQPDRQKVVNHLRHESLKELRVQRASPLPDARDAYDELKERVLWRLTEDIGGEIIQRHHVASRALIKKRLDTLLVEEHIILKREEKRRLATDLIDKLLGLGPLEPLLNLDGVDQIMINGPKDIVIRRSGRLQHVNATFEDEAHLMHIIQRMIAPLSHHLDQDSPILVARLADGAQLNVVIPPATSDGPAVTITRAVPTIYTIQELIQTGMLTDEIARFLQAAVMARLNVIITGLAGTGKTTLLQALCSLIPREERIVTIEEVAELQLDQDYVIAMTTHLANSAGSNNISAETLIMTSSRICPDRLILGCIQGSEACSWLQAINAGLGGSMTTCYGEGPQDSLARIEVLAQVGGPTLPLHFIRNQITSAVDIIVHLEQLPDNSRKVVSISEVTGFENGHYVTAEIHKFEQTVLEYGHII